VQYVVAQFLREFPGAITQLNMGEGKTRVILPMLLLSLAQPDLLLRLHFLSPLLGEAYHSMHRHLTASLMCRRLYLLPFHRDVRLEPQSVQRIYESLLRCKASLGAVCVAPAAAGQEATCAQLRRVIEEIPYLNLVDESDEILPKFELIYAVGSCCELPAGKKRWVGAQALLKQLQTSTKIAAILQDRNVARRLSVLIERGAGAFDDTRLLQGSCLEEVTMGLMRLLVEGVMDDPPYDMRWLRDHPLRETIVTFMTEGEKSLEWLDRQPNAQLVRQGCQLDQLLAMRGMLACGLLLHCMGRRHCVDYGVDRRRGRSRRVAVPYRASDTPAERAEYAQPDTMILLTHLSYYHDGLTVDEVREAVRVLLAQGPIAQREEYALWLRSVGLSTAEQGALDDVRKFDLSNELQLALLHTVYAHNMTAVDFWLATCVLSRESMQFPHRLVSSAFHLADNVQKRVTGFSGTKDNTLLLPLQMQQMHPECAELKGTDGRMLDLVRRCRRVICLDGSLPSKAVLELAVPEADALIDAGATMADLSNEQMAQRVLDLLPASSRFQGVAYFSLAGNAWYVTSRHGRRWAARPSVRRTPGCTSTRADAEART
jgi:hypothetical protein